MSSSREKLLKRLATAARAVLDARNIVFEQEQRIERLRGARINASEAEHQLSFYKRTLMNFEDDYRKIKRELDEASK